MRNSESGISIGAHGAIDADISRPVFLCHATPADDNVYWLETVTPDGAVKLSPLEAIEKEAEGISQSLILCAHTHIARAVRTRQRTSGGQSR